MAPPPRESTQPIIPVNSSGGTGHANFQGKSPLSFPGLLAIRGLPLSGDPLIRTRSRIVENVCVVGNVRVHERRGHPRSSVVPRPTALALLASWALDPAQVAVLLAPDLAGVIPDNSTARPLPPSVMQAIPLLMGGEGRARLYWPVTSGGFSSSTLLGTAKKVSLHTVHPPGETLPPALGPGPLGFSLFPARTVIARHFFFPFPLPIFGIGVRNPTSLPAVRNPVDFSDLEVDRERKSAPIAFCDVEASFQLILTRTRGVGKNKG